MLLPSAISESGWLLEEHDRANTLGNIASCDFFSARMRCPLFQPHARWISPRSAPVAEASLARLQALGTLS